MDITLVCGAEDGEFNSPLADQIFSGSQPVRRMVLAHVFSRFDSYPESQEFKL